MKEFFVFVALVLCGFGISLIMPGSARRACTKCDAACCDMGHDKCSCRHTSECSCNPTTGGGN